MKYKYLSALLASTLFTGILSTSPAQAQAPDSVVISRLTKIDEKVGTGKEALAGNTVYVHYTGWLHDPFANRERGTKFDSSVGQQAFSFSIGSGRVIKGWEQGVAGMKVGGKRTLIIPPELGYGAAGAGNGMIPPNSYLIFDIELLDVR
ncbi:FKBP-type peptidyl-prolyl cis-trans isomerase [Undibacterium sp. Ji83W]|uniref:FKBP-type peptidyl-prolyl cis-trans isomerase n=1 Tax=Undibacterium sp. Ji83W TaxID=3413043 RepID=UPI003BF41F6A